MTFVEILVVLVLVGLAALVMVVNLQTIQRRFRINSETNELTAFLQSVPKYARENNASVFLIWNNGERRFVIATDAGGANVLDSLTIPPEVTISGPAAPVLRCDIYGRTFIGTGTTMMTTIQTITLSHTYATEASAPTYRLSLSPLWSVLMTKV